MKILFLTRRFYPYIGGVEKHTLEVASRLAKLNHEVKVVTEGIPSNFKSISNIKIYRIPVGGGEKLKKFQIWFWLWKNRNLIKEADVIHCHDVFYWYLPFRFIFFKKPVFITFHGWEGKFPIPKRNLLMRKIGEKLAWGNICVGDYLKKWYGTRPNFVTYGGVEEFREIDVKKGSKLKIVFVGRMERDLDLPVYFKILKNLKRRKINFEIEFYGDGNLKKKAEKFGKVLGFARHILPKINSANIVFASSYLSVLEALSLRKVVISVWNNPLKKDYFLLSPFKEVITSGSDPEKLAEKIIYLLNNQKETNKRLDRGYQWAKKQTWGKVADLYLRLWKL